MRSASVPCGTSSTSISPAIMPFWVSGLRPICETIAARRAGVDQPANAETRLGGVIGDDGEVLAPGVDQGVDHAVRRADAHEAADHQDGAIGDHLGGFLRSNAFFHRRPSLSILSRPLPR